MRSRWSITLSGSGIAAISRATASARRWKAGSRAIASTASRTASAVTDRDSSTIATPAAAQRSALSGWSAASGTMIAGRPAASAVSIVPDPPWKATMSAADTSVDIGTYARTTTPSGTSPSVEGSAPTATTTWAPAATVPSMRIRSRPISCAFIVPRVTATRGRPSRVGNGSAVSAGARDPAP